MGKFSGLSKLFWQHYHGSDARASYRWMLSLFAAFVLFPGVGSGGSILFAGIWLFSLPYWLFDRDARSFNRNEAVLVSVFAAYFLIMAAFAFAHAARLDQTTGFGAIYSNLPFLLIGPVLPVLRRAARPEWLERVFAGIAWGAILAAALVTIGAWFFPEIGRKALSGNALVLALGALVSGMMCNHGVLFFSGRMRWLAAAGALASLFVLLTTGSRGPILSYGVAVTLYAVIMGYRHFGLRWMLGRYVAWLLIFIASIAVVEKSDPQLSQRINIAVERLSKPSDQTIKESSVRTRFVLYEAGLRAFLDQPLAGYGRQNAVKATKDHSNGAADEHFHFTHLHNGYLTDLVSSGVLGLLSLLAVLLAPLALFWNARPVVFGGVLSVTLAYVLYGATNLLFYHDVVTLLYLSLMCVFSALSPLGTSGDQRSSG